MKIKTILVVIIAVIVTLILFGLFSFWFGREGVPVGSGWYMFSFAAGLTMIVLPCTLPLAFVIVPLSMGKGPAKGLGIALSFALGVTIMLSLYGIVTAAVGKGAMDGLKADIETVKNWMYLFAGTFAFLFALGEIGLLKFRMPTYTGAAPGFIQRQGDFFKAFLLGLFLGNIGIGCPHPATPVILTRIATSGDIFYGWMLFLVHAVGRVLPLLLLAVLAILGVNALNWLVARKDKIERATGWGMVFVAGYILVLGLFSHDWWVASGQHSLFESLTQESALTGIIAQKIGTGAAHTHEMPTGTGLFGLPLALGNWVLVFLWTLPLWWYYFKRKKEVAGLPEAEEKHIGQKDLSDKKWLYLTLTVLFAVVIIYTLPQRFTHMSMGSGDHMMSNGQMMQDHPHAPGTSVEHDHGTGGYQYHEAKDVTQGLVVNLILFEQQLAAGEPVRIGFEVANRSQGKDTHVDSNTLELEHTKLMHVLGVRSDLNEFLHIHPIPGPFNALDDVFMQEYIFQKPGRYKIWAEIKKDGIIHTFGQQEIIVTGSGAVEEKQVEYGRSKIVGNPQAGIYQVLLHHEDKVQATKNTPLHFEIHDANGKEIEVEPYLGADMHLNLIRDDLTELIHTHPGGAAHEHTYELIKRVYADTGHDHGSMMASDHGIPFEVVFSKPGLYRAFAQFRPKGTNLPQDEALIASFWVQVQEPSGLSGGMKKLILVLISLVLMYLLSKGVKKYLTVT